MTPFARTRCHLLLQQSGPLARWTGLQRLENLFAKRSFWKATREELYVVTPSNLGIPLWGTGFKTYFKGTNQTVQLVMGYWDKMAMGNRPTYQWMEDNCDPLDNGRLRPQVHEWKSSGPIRKLWGITRQGQNESHKLGGAWLRAAAHE